MRIASQPDQLSFLGSMKNLVLEEVSAPVTLEFWASGQPLVTEQYEAPPAGRLEVSVKDIVKHTFSGTPRIEDLLSEITLSDNFKYFSVRINGVITIGFGVIGGMMEGIQNVGFLKKEFLNMCPQAKTTTISSIEILNVYIETELQYPLMCRCHLAFGNEPVELTLAILRAGLNIIPVNFNSILSMLPAESRLIAVDVYVDRPDFYGQRFDLTEEGVYEDAYYFLNSLGGVELIRMDGEKTSSGSYSSIEAQRGNELTDYDNDVSVTFAKNTGHLTSPVEKEFARDFLRSDNRYHVIGRKLTRRIILLSSTADTALLTLDNFEFEYRYPQEDVFVRLRSNIGLPERLGVDIASFCFDRSTYELWMSIEKLESDLRALELLTGQQYSYLQAQIDSLRTSVSTINDNSPSLTTVYSGSKVEAIKQQLANLFPYKVSGSNVRINQLIGITATDDKAREIIPMLACAGTIQVTMGVYEKGISYGYLGWTVDWVDDKPRLIHNLGHSDYVFLAQGIGKDVSDRINAVSDNYVEFLSPDTSKFAIHFAILTFKDTRSY